MSHGTGSGYAVVSQVELNRRCVESARLRCVSLTARLLSVASQTGQRIAVAQTPTSPSVTVWARYEAELRAQLERAFAQIEQGASQARQAEVIAVVPNWQPAADWVGESAEEPADDLADGEAEERVRASIGRALDLVARVEDPAHRRRLATLADRALRVLDEDRAQARGHLNTIRSEAQASLRLQSARTLLAKRAEAARHDYADVGGERAQVLRDGLQHVVGQADLDAIEAELTQIRDAATAEADRRYVIEQAAEALRDLGYQIGDEFVPSALEQRTVVRTPNLPGYGVELDFQKKRRRLVTEVVAYTADRRGDLAAEEAFCEHLEALAEKLGDAVALTREQTIEPGAAEVVRISAVEPVAAAVEREAAR
ncbi:hypothetical protein [Nocardioides baekrokdamisoli]|nr:hypothetical protein [Nocardioides baekrokdamisoli]